MLSEDRDLRRTGPSQRDNTLRLALIVLFDGVEITD